MAQMEGYVPGETETRTAEMEAGSEPKVGILSILAELKASTEAIGKLAENIGVNIGDVTVDNVAGSGAYVQPGTAATWDVSSRADRDLGKLDIAAFDAALPAGTNNIGKVDPATATPTAYNVTLTVADTEYSQALPANCRGFEFQARTEATVRYAFVTGKVATPTAPWLTLKAGDYYYSPPLNQAASPSTLYIGSATAGTIVEILAWV